MPFEWKPHWDHEKVDETKCRAGVHDATGVGFHQCTRKAKVDGKWCKQHSPEEEKRRREESDKRWDEQRDQQARATRNSAWWLVIDEVKKADKELAERLTKLQYELGGREQ